MSKRKLDEQGQMEKNILDDTERLADALERLEGIGEVLKGSRLKEKAVLVLLSHYTKLPQDTISRVFEGLVNIRRAYLKP